MRQTIPERDRLFGRVQQLAQDCMITGQKLRPIHQGDMNHRAPRSQRYIPGPEPEPVTLPWPLSLNQVHLLLALRLLSRQVRQLVQCVEIGPRRGLDDVRVRAMT